MNREKLKVPFCDNEAECNERLKKSIQFQFIIGESLLLILIISLFVTNIFTMSRVRNLENEVAELKRVSNMFKMLDDELINQIIGFENEDLEDDDPEIFISEPEEPNEYVDYENYDQVSSNGTEDAQSKTEGVNGKVYVSSANLTKDGKESMRIKRNVIAATDDGVLVNSETYAEKKARNNTFRKFGISITSLPAQPSSFGYPAPIHHESYSSEIRSRTSQPPPTVLTRQSRVMHHEDKSKAFRQLVKKSSLKSGGSYQDSYEETSSSPDFTIIRDEGFARRRYRQRHSNLEVLDEKHPRFGRIKPLPSIHYNGDTSRYIVGQHPNFNGNGHIRHNQRTFIDWRPSNWVESLEMDSHFRMNEGILTIKESGLYFVYSQIYYLDEHDQAGYRVYKNADIILQCTVTAHSSERRMKGNTCYTAGVEYLSDGDTVSIADVSEGRYSLFEPGKSFFGVVKLGDVRIK